MRFLLTHIKILPLLLLCTISKGQITGAHVYTISNDGTAIKINTVSKHSKGYFLIGTNNGLYRFDGISFTPYTFDSVVNNKSITAIGEDRKGNVWLGFQNGEMATLNGKKIQLLKAEEGHPAIAITDIVADNTGTVYFATAGEGIYYYVNKRFYNINMDDGLSDNYVYDLAVENASLIASTDRGVNTIAIKGSRKEIQAFTSAHGLPDNIVRCISRKNITAGGPPQYWLGMQDKGVGYYSPFNVSSYFGYNDTWAYGQVNSIIGTDKQLWIATQNAGVVIIKFADKERNVAAEFINDPSYGKTSNLIDDNEGNLWFTSNDKLVKTNGARLQNILPLTKTLYEQIHTILNDKHGNVWVNFNNGLKKFTYSTKSGSWKEQTYFLKEIDSKTDITCLYEDLFGRIWAGTLGKGIIIFDPTTGKSRIITEDQLLLRSSILSINGKDNDIWISSLEGAVHCTFGKGNEKLSEPYTFQNFSKVSGLGSNYIYSVFRDSKDRVWFATDGKGITVYENGSFKNYNEKDGIKSQVIYTICEDKTGNIWFSALNDGVYKFDGKKFLNISTSYGLNDPTITSLAVDAANNILALSKKGINIINAENNQITYLDQNQGLQEVNLDLNCISTYNDAVFLVTSSGIMKYIPTQTSFSPKIALEGVQLFLGNIDVSRNNRFSYDENNFTFSYLGVSFSHPEKIRYQYMLEGLSNQWVTTKDNTINFPKLLPGKYTFRVRASINNRYEGNEEASFSFTINRPFWLQWWFIGGLISLLIIAFYLFVKDRERRVKRWERLEKEKIQSQFETLKSQVNPHFLFNSFNTLISVIEDDQDKAVEYVEHLSDLYRKIVTYRDKDIITLKEELDIINDYFFIQRKRFGDNLQLINHINGSDQLSYSIAPLTLQLLTENAVKHNAISAETPLVIELMIEEKSLVVKNNINVKMTKESGAGMGLQNIQKRYKLLSNEEVIITKTEKHFIVRIPLLKTQP